MARITKEIKKLIAEYELHHQDMDYAQHKMETIRLQLIELGMTEKQLEDRDICEAYEW